MFHPRWRVHFFWGGGVSFLFMTTQGMKARGRKKKHEDLGQKVLRRWGVEGIQLKLVTKHRNTKNKET